MATVTVKASFMLNTGEIVDCSSSMVEGTETELTTSTAYSVAAVSIGQFADGKVITQILQPPSGLNGASFAYIDRRGEIYCILPVAVQGVQDRPMPIARTFALQAGDTIRVMCSTAASRLFSYNAITTSGVHSIFTGTPAGDTISLTQIKTSQGLGASLTGQTIATHWATSVDGAKLSTGGGVYLLSEIGLPVGGVAATNPIKLQGDVSTVGTAPIKLNYVARVTTSS